MRILLCDDNPVFLEALRTEIRRVLNAQQMEAMVFPVETLEGVSDDLLSSCNVFFLDIDFAGKTYNGIDIAKKVRRQNPEAVIVFITNYVSYAPEGYEVQAFRYILKNEFKQKLEHYLPEIMDKLIAEQEPIRINISNEVISIPVADVLYMETEGHIVAIYIQKKGTQAIKTYRFYESLTNLEQQLASRGFLRIHKSYLVNMRRIKKYQCTGATLDNGTALRVSEKNYSQQKKLYLRWKGRQ